MTLPHWVLLALFAHEVWPVAAHVWHSLLGLLLPDE